MEKLHPKEAVRLTTIGILALALSACIPAGTEAYTTPLGITYLNGSEKNPSVVLHEEQHWKDYQDDPLFFVKYMLSQQYACEAEKRANVAGHIYPADNHPACENLPK